MDSTKKLNSLYQTFYALYQSLIVVYFEFSTYFHGFALLIMMVLFFKLGKASVSEPIVDRAKKIRNKIQKIQKMRHDILEQIKQTTKFYKTIIIISLALIIITFILTYNEQLIIELYYIAVSCALPLFFYIVLVFKTKLLKNKLANFPKQEKQIYLEVQEVMRMFGGKVLSILKGNLCRDKILSRKKQLINTCTKRKCKELRQLLKIQYEAIKNLAEKALDFEWCSICSNKGIFDELVKFEQKILEEQKYETEEDDVNAKISFLMDNLVEMLAWIQSASPCNCCKIYMEQVLKEKKNFNHVKKDITQQLKKFKKFE